MAERRMFAKSIVLSDAFLDMPLSARCLYFTLGMLADDDGFVSSPKAIMRQCGASVDDMNVLLSKRYVLSFESGVIVIKHWRINNYLREDRHKDTTYIEELKTLAIDERGAYTEVSKFGIPSANQVSTNGIPSIGKDSIGKDSIKKSKRFTPPTLEEVKEYAHQMGDKVDPVKFFEYYTEGNWVDAKGQSVKNWKQKMITWESRQSKHATEMNKKIHNYTERSVNYAELAKEIIGK